LHSAIKFNLSKFKLIKFKLSKLSKTKIVLNSHHSYLTQETLKICAVEFRKMMIGVQFEE